MRKKLKNYENKMKKNILEIFIGLLLLFFYAATAFCFLYLITYIVENEFVMKMLFYVLMCIFFVVTAKLLGKNFLRKLDKKYRRKK